MEVKQFAVLSKQNIELWIESLGNCKVADEVLEILSEDITYRVRELIHNSLKYMKHSKRTCLTVEDINNSLKESDTEQIFGHNGSDSVTFKSVPLKEGAKICFVDEKDVNLRDIALDPSYPSDPGEIGVKANWLLLEGHPCSSGISREELKGNLSEPSATYFQNMTHALIGNKKELRKIALEDLKTNQKLQIVIPHLVAFCSAQIKHHTGKNSFSDVAYQILFTIDALVKNSSVVLAPYVVQLAKIMLFILIEAKVPVASWHIKEKASTILSSLSSRGMNSGNNLKEQLLKSYTETLADPSKPLSHLFGAVVGIKKLGINAIWQGLFPKAKEKLRLVDSCITQANTEIEKQELLTVLYVITDALAMLFKPPFDSTRSQLQRRKSPSFTSLHRELMDVAGESFLASCLTANYSETCNSNTTAAQFVQSNGKNTQEQISKSKTDISMEKDKATETIKNTSKQLKISTTSTNMGSINTKLKIMSNPIRIHLITGEESVVFTRSTRADIRKSKNIPRGSHVSLVKRRKLKETLCMISSHLPML